MKRLIASILISAMIIFGLPINAPVIRDNIGESFARVFTTPDASAAWVFRNFSGINKAAVFSTVPFDTKDYLPKTAFIHCGGASGGSLFKVIIYDSSKNIISNAISSEVTNSNNIISVTFSNVSALVPGNKYYIAIMQNGYQYYYCSGSYAINEQNNTYPNAPSSISGSNKGFGKPLVNVKNLSGQIILGESDISGGTKNVLGSSGAIVFYSTSGYTCNTL